MGQGRIAAAVCLRAWRGTLRHPVTLSFSLLQPMMWMLFFGFLFYRYRIVELGPELAYIDFLLPGVCCMTVLFGASQSGVAYIRDIQQQLLGRILQTPAGRGALLSGKLAADTVRLLLQALVVFVLGTLIGANWQLDPALLLRALMLLVLFAGSFCAISCAIALLTRRNEAMATFVHFINMPLLFTSSVLVPLRQMPPWLEHIARLNPLTHVADTLRAALLSGWAVPPLRHDVFLLCFAVCTFLLAYLILQRSPRD
jgi:ABC-2 type transport system permease protein